MENLEEEENGCLFWTKRRMVWRLGFLFWYSTLVPTHNVLNTCNMRILSFKIMLNIINAHKNIFNSHMDDFTEVQLLCCCSHFRLGL